MTGTSLPPIESQPNTPLAAARPPSAARRASLRTFFLIPLRAAHAALGSVASHPWLSLLVVALLAAIALGTSIVGLNIWAGYHFRSAQANFERYHDAEAMTHLEACLQVWPHDPQTLLMAARVARRLGAFPEARELLDRYESARGEDDKLTLESILLRAEEGDLDSVREFCEMLVEQHHPDTPLILEAQARGYLRQFRLQDAMAALKKWLDFQPENPQAHFLHGKVSDEMLDLKGAIACYRRVLKVDPDQDEARMLLASHLLDLAQARKALTHLTILNHRQPDNLKVRVSLARCRAELGQTEAAERILGSVLAEHPHHAEALAERGYLALQMGKLDVAEAWLRAAAAREPANYQVRYQLSQALIKNGKLAEARALEKKMKDLQADIKRIQEIVTQQMQASPHDPALHYETAVIALRVGNAREGLRWLQSALRENPNYAPAHNALAVYYQEMGSPGRAAQHREAVRALGAAKK
jgi:tetratricopeptide (TPR) repeat protein